MRVTSPTISKTFPVGRRGALQFYGMGDRVELPELKLEWEKDKPTPYSVELWLKPTLPRDQTILYAPAGKAGEEPPFVFKVTAAGAVQAGHAKGHLLEVKDALQWGVWQHLAFVFGGEKAGYLYVNGERKGPDGEMPRSNPWERGIVLSYPIRNESVEGQIAMLRIWKIDRFDREIREFMYQSVTGPDRRWLVTEWLLNEGFGEFVFDRSRRLGRSRQRNLYEEPGAGRLVAGEMKRKPEWVASAVPRRPMHSAAGTQAVCSLAPLVNEKMAAQKTGMFLTEFIDHPKKDKPKDQFRHDESSFTVELWVKKYDPLADGVNYVLFAHWPWKGKEAQAEVLRIGLTSKTFFMSFSRALTIDYSQDGQWHHWACVYDHSKFNRRIFCDGKLCPREDNEKYTVADAKAFLLWTAGTDQGYTAAPCMLSEVRVWKEARSAEQIKANMLRRLDGTEPKLLLYCPLDRQDELADKTSVVRARVRYPADADDQPTELRRFPTEGFERRLSWLNDGPPIPPRSFL